MVYCMKKDKIYQALLPLRVATFEEIVAVARAQGPAEASSKYIFTKYIDKLVKEGKLCRIQKGIYGVLEPLDDQARYIPDKFLVGAKIRKGGFLSYHTALELHGCAYSAFYNTVYVCVKRGERFDPFSFRGLKFRPVFVQDAKGTEMVKYAGQEIRVTDKERTFLDCLSKPRYAGGWEECLKSLQALEGLNFERLLAYLSERGNKFLLRKVGFTLELLKQNSVFYEHLKDEQLQELRRGARGPPSYLEPVERGKLNKDWLLYVPEGFEERVLRGV